MKQSMRLFAAALVLLVSVNVHAFHYGSKSSEVGGQPFLITWSIVLPWDLLVTESWVSGHFYKKFVPNAYDIRTVWGKMSTWRPGFYFHAWRFVPKNPGAGTHCVYGHHRFFYLDLFGYTFNSGPDCVHTRGVAVSPDAATDHPELTDTPQ